MYVRYQNALVHIEDAPIKQALITKSTNPHPTANAPRTTLWADRPFTVAKGRLLGVRKTGLLIEVALMASGSTSLAWQPANNLLTQSQINRWLNSCSFRTK
jgi:hypothetical protein